MARSFETWLFGFRGFLRLELGVEDFLDAVSKLETVPTDADLCRIIGSDENKGLFDGQLYALLTTL